MMRKTFFVLALSLVTLITSAQIGVGQWKIHPYFIGGDVTNCVDAGHHVYYLSKGSLFCYDKSTHSNMPIDATNVINDENIKWKNTVMTPEEIEQTKKKIAEYAEKKGKED